MTASIAREADAETGADNRRNEAAMARVLVERLNAAGLRSTADLLQALRQAFPNSPLSVRVAALRALSLR